MTGRNPGRRVRAAVALAALLAVAAGTLVTLRLGQAQTVPFAPQVAAAFEDKDSRLVVGVILSAAQQQDAAGKLQVDVRDAQGKILAQATKGLTSADAFAGYRFEFPVKKDQAEGLTVHCQ